MKANKIAAAELIIIRVTDICTQKEEYYGTENVRP